MSHNDGGEMLCYRYYHRLMEEGKKSPPFRAMRSGSETRQMGVPSNFRVFFRRRDSVASKKAMLWLCLARLHST